MDVCDVHCLCVSHVDCKLQLQYALLLFMCFSLTIQSAVSNQTDFENRIRDTSLRNSSAPPDSVRKVRDVSTNDSASMAQLTSPSTTLGGFNSATLGMVIGIVFGTLFLLSIIAMCWVLVIASKHKNDSSATGPVLQGMDHTEEISSTLKGKQMIQQRESKKLKAMSAATKNVSNEKAVKATDVTSITPKSFLVKSKDQSSLLSSASPEVRSVTMTSPNTTVGLSSIGVLSSSDRQRKMGVLVAVPRPADKATTSASGSASGSFSFEDLKGTAKPAQVQQQPLAKKAPATAAPTPIDAKNKVQPK